MVETGGAMGYIGVSNHLRRRAGEIVYKKYGKTLLSGDRIKYSAFKEGSVSRAQISATEKSHIRRHEPQRNITRGGNRSYRAQ